MLAPDGGSGGGSGAQPPGWWVWGLLLMAAAGGAAAFAAAGGGVRVQRGRGRGVAPVEVLDVEGAAEEAGEDAHAWVWGGVV